MPNVTQIKKAAENFDQTRSHQILDAKRHANQSAIENLDQTRDHQILDTERHAYQWDAENLEFGHP